MKMIISYPTVFLVLSFFVVISLSSPVCHDTVPFSTKLAQSLLVVSGDLVDVSTPLFINNHTTPFNMTFTVRCIFKGIRPMNEKIIIEHTPPGRKDYDQ